MIGFGSVHGVKSKNAVTLVVSAPLGIEKVVRLISNKLRTPHRFDQLLKNVLLADKFSHLRGGNKFELNVNPSFQNH